MYGTTAISQHFRKKRHDSDTSSTGTNSVDSIYSPKIPIINYENSTKQTPKLYKTILTNSSHPHQKYTTHEFGLILYTRNHPKLPNVPHFLVANYKYNFTSIPPGIPKYYSSGIVYFFYLLYSHFSINSIGNVIVSHKIRQSFLRQ